jgi:hypothetical protein
MATRILLMLALAGAVPVLTQTNTGTIRVLATDHAEAVLPNVRILLAGSLNREAVTDSQGVAVLDRLPVGAYQLTTLLPGFRDERVALDVRPASTTSQRVVMLVAPDTETIITTGCKVVDLPETLQEFSKRADAIAHVRIREQRAQTRLAPGTTQTEVNSHSTVEIITVFKRHSQWPMQGRAEVLQLGGDVVRGAQIERVRHLCNTPLVVGREYVLFLERSKWLRGWGVLFGDNGAFLTNGEQVESSGDGEFPRSWRFRPAADLFAALAKLQQR